MTEPCHHLIRRACDGTRRYGGPVDQDHRQTQTARGSKFGVRADATCVLRYDMGDVVRLHQGEVALLRERSARENHLGTRQGQHIGWRIDQTQEIVMLRTGREGVDPLLADRQKNPRSRIGQCSDRARRIGDHAPIIAPVRHPGRPLKREKRDTGCSARLYRIVAHTGGKGMSRVDHMTDASLAQPGGKALRSTKTSCPDRQRLRARRDSPARIGKYGVYSGGGQHARHLTGFSGAAQKKDACHD